MVVNLHNEVKSGVNKKVANDKWIKYFWVLDWEFLSRYANSINSTMNYDINL